MKLPEKDYFTFFDICSRFKCDPSYLHHLIATEKIKPSLFIEGMYWSIDLHEDEIDDDFVYVPHRTIKRRISRLMYLQNIRSTGVDKYEFSYFTTERDTPPGKSYVPDPWEDRMSGSQWFIFGQGEEANEVIISDEGVFMLAEINRFETLHDTTQAADVTVVSPTEPTGKSRTSYLHIIGALCDMYWKEKYPNEKKIVQSRIIEVLTDTYRDYPGMSERNLKSHLSEAIKFISSS